MILMMAFHDYYFHPFFLFLDQYHVALLKNVL